MTTGDKIKEYAAMGGIGILFIIGIILLVILLYCIGAAFGGLIIWIGAKLICPFFGWPVLTYKVSFGIALILAMVGGAFKATINRSN